jgi:hypothetical protein
MPAYDEQATVNVGDRVKHTALMLHLLLPHSQPDRPLYVFRLQLRHPAPYLHPPSPLHSERTEALASSQVQARLCFVVQCVRAVPAVLPLSAAHLTTPRRSVSACTASRSLCEPLPRATGATLLYRYYLLYLALRTYGIRHLP